MNLFKINKNVIILSSGTIFGQIVLIVTTPFLSRLYNVASFGYLAEYISITTILGTLFTLKYELSIPIPTTNKTRINLVLLTVLVSLLLSVVLFVLLLLLNEAYFHLYYIYIYAIPFTIVVISIQASLQQWFNRNDEYFRIAIYSIVVSFSNVIVALMFSVFNNKYGLVWAFFISYSVGCFYLVFSFFIKCRFAITSIKYLLLRLLCLAIKYINFPKYVLLSAGFSVVSYQMIPLLLKYCYNSQVVGFYSMANRLLVLPALLLGNSLGTVFRVELAKIYSDREKSRCLLKETIYKQIIWGGPLFIFIFIFSPFLFKSYLGTQWAIAGDYSRLILLFVSSHFLSTTFNNVFTIFSKEKLYLKFQFIYTLIPILSIIIGKVIFNGVEYSLLILSIAIFVVTLINLNVAFKIVK